MKLLPFLDACVGITAKGFFNNFFMKNVLKTSFASSFLASK